MASLPKSATRTPRRKPSPRPRRSERPPAASNAQSIEEAFALAISSGGGAVAVSGGSDSLALMHLLAAQARRAKRKPPVVLTVDHGLRRGSSTDSRKVVAWARQTGLKAHILTWKGAKPKSGVEAAAREARYALMGAWMVKHRIATLYVGHTLDDQAETFLLRLARGSGLDGLAAMRARAPWPVPGFAGLSVSRPLLTLSRAELRAYLQSRGQPWLDDPMNDDDAFDRVKIRRAGTVLAELGLTAPRLAAAAAHLGRARAALESMTEALLAEAAGKSAKGQGMILKSGPLAAAPREVGLRALAAVLMQVSGQAYRPRFDALERLFNRIAEGTVGGGVTLHGCHVGPARPPGGTRGDNGTLLVTREKPRKAAGSLKKATSAG